MTVTGIIAEYNPFHRGHAYQIQEARDRTNADYIIVIMSGNYVQRGAPAITDKFVRAKMALLNGADMVFELPVLWATASSGDFAAAGIAHLHRLGCVTHISYGCETTHHEIIPQLAEILAEEPKDFSRLLLAHLREGKSFPLARELAFLSYYKAKPSLFSGFPVTEEILKKIFSSPNNILALEYQKAMRRRQVNFSACPILREGADYHDSGLNQKFPSAAGIRKQLFENPDFYAGLKDFLPDSAAGLMAPEMTCLMHENDFSQMLYYRLLSESSQGYESYGGSSPFLSKRIRKNLNLYRDYKSFCGQIKTKDTTYARVSRLLLHILLDITQEHVILGKQLDYIPYFRLLGFQKRARPLLKEIKRNGLSPILTRPAKTSGLLTEDARLLYEKDVFSSNLYYGVRRQKGSDDFRNEYQKNLVIL